MALPRLALHQAHVESAIAPRSIGHDLVTNACIESICPAMATLVVAMRLALRKRYKVSINWSDYLMVVGLVFFWAQWSLWLYMSSLAPSGLSNIPSGSLTSFLKAAFSMSLVPLPGAAMIKVSILLFYLGAFGTVRYAKPLLYGLIAFQVTLTTARFVGGLVICTSDYWTDQSACYRRGMLELYLAGEIINAVAEVLILVFPVPIIWHLRAPMKTKIGMWFAFSIGSIAVATMLARLALIMQWINGTWTWEDDNAYPALILCGMFEWVFGIIGGSVPTFHRPLQSFVKDLTARIRGKQPHSESGSEKTYVLDLEKPKSSIVVSEIEEPRPSLADGISPQSKETLDFGR